MCLQPKFETFQGQVLHQDSACFKQGLKSVILEVVVDENRLHIVAIHKITLIFDQILGVCFIYFSPLCCFFFFAVLYLNFYIFVDPLIAATSESHHLRSKRLFSAYRISFLGASMNESSRCV